MCIRDRAEYAQNGRFSVVSHSGHGDPRTVTARLPNFPDAPTFQEAGYPDVIYILWAGVFAPKKTPEHVTRILRNTVRPFMQDKAVVERFLTAGSQVSYLDGPDFARFLEGDTDRLVRLVRKIGLS